MESNGIYQSRLILVNIIINSFSQWILKRSNDPFLFIIKLLLPGFGFKKNDWQLTKYLKIFCGNLSVIGNVKLCFVF